MQRFAVGVLGKAVLFLEPACLHKAGYCGVLREPLLLHQQLQGFQAPRFRPGLGSGRSRPGPAEDGTNAQGLKSPRRAMLSARLWIGIAGRIRRTFPLASFEAVERDGDGSRKAELGASHESLRGSDWTLKTGADAGRVRT